MTQEHRVLSTKAPLGEIQPIGSANNGGGEGDLVQTVDPSTPAPGASWEPRWPAGPWNLYRGEEGEALGVQKFVTGNQGGTVTLSLGRMAFPNLSPSRPSTRITQEELNAVARLWAAAPDLYEVVATLIGALDANPNAPLADVMFAWRVSDNGERAARAALAKANPTEGAGGQ